MGVLPASILLRKPVLSEDEPWLGLPLHYGWPAAEQEAFEQGSGLAFVGHLGVVRVSGVDRLSWLSTLSSQVLGDLVPGVSKEALLLDQQGRISFAFGAIDDGENTWLLTESKFAADLTVFLKSMQFMLRVDVADVTDNFLGFSQVRKGRFADVVVPEGSLVWDDPWPGIVDGGAAYFQGSHGGRWTPFRLVAVPTHSADLFVESVLSGSGVPGSEDSAVLVGLLAVEATRVAAWRPLVSAEVDSRALPAELDWLRTAVHTNKGCYCGQESVARIINLGKPPRRLVFLQLDGSGAGAVKRGSEVTLNSRQVGVVTSVAEHYEMGPIALALVKRNLDPDVQLSVDGVDAAQELIVPVDGRSDHSPSVRPGVGLKRIVSDRRDIRSSGTGSKH